MISRFNSRAAAVHSAPFLASFFLLAFLGAPQRALAGAPQSSNAPSAQATTCSGPCEKDSAVPRPVLPLRETNAPKPHRVFTNDDLSPSSGIPILRERAAASSSSIDATVLVFREVQSKR